MAKVWIVGGKEFTHKATAYRHMRTLNGKKVNGNKPFKVQRKMNQ